VGTTIDDDANDFIFADVNQKGNVSMATPANAPRGAHLNGSVPLENNTAVFTLAGTVLGKHLHRVPDGETGVRTNWIGWQFPLLAGLPYFQIAKSQGGVYGGRDLFTLRPGITAGQVQLPALGYGAAARESFVEFSRLKHEGVIPRGVRFQVCLPTPVAVIEGNFVPQDQPAVEPLYEARLTGELDEILRAIPAAELAIQWDVAVEFAILEGMLSTYFTDAPAAIRERLLRLGERVPAGVELGYHLCYGDAGHHHFKEPEDTSKLVMVANALAEGLKRPLNWIHLPVPRSRKDDAYFAPLKGLKLHPETELYLGLVHYTDGLEGARARIMAAQSAVAEFGVATECGMGRRPPATIPDLLQLHAQLAEPIR
jgi:hypothetical protein